MSARRDRMLGLLWLLLALPTMAQVQESERYLERETYQAALDHLTARRMGAFHRAREQLTDYPLRPYLDYYELQTRLPSVSDEDMRAFQQRHGDLPVAGVMRQRWLRQIGGRREWARFLEHYRPSSDAELQCLHLRALYNTGARSEALAAVGPLWRVAHSQPKACDPMFEAWIDAGELTEGDAWERLQLALAANQRSLARYLLRFFNGGLKPWAEALYHIHQNPHALADSRPLMVDSKYARVIIAHGLTRLAASDAGAARNAWRRFQDTHSFEPAEEQRLDETIWLAEAREGRFPDPRPAVSNGEFSAAIANLAVQAQQWHEALHWIERLPPDRLHENQWQYWLARALVETHGESQRAVLTYQALARQREYYGFLAAEALDQPIELNDASIDPDDAAVAELEQRPAVRRMLELYAVRDLVNARREWYAMLSDLDADESLGLAHLLRQVGWISLAIHTANVANLHDQLALRFPVVYSPLFQRVGHATAVPQAFLLAIARQESAFDPRARSSANARGLMQLMHSTATETAGRAGRNAPSTADLYEPGTNVELGGRHMAELLAIYGDRRPLAAAAYNAGRSRVDRWTRGKSGVPMDVWIESIPFRETRNYVKNVLAFAQVYGALLDDRRPMLQAQERTLP